MPLCHRERRELELDCRVRVVQLVAVDQLDEGGARANMSSLQEQPVDAAIVSNVKQTVTGDSLMDRVNK